MPSPTAEPQYGRRTTAGPDEGEPPARARGYVRDSGSLHRAFALKVLTVRRERIAASTGLGYRSSFRFFALPAARAF